MKIMSQKEIVKRCRELGCCDACCVRYLGLKTPTAYEDSHQFLSKFEEASVQPDAESKEEIQEQSENKTLQNGNCLLNIKDTVELNDENKPQEQNNLTNIVTDSSPDTNNTSDITTNKTPDTNITFDTSMDKTPDSNNRTDKTPDICDQSNNSTIKTPDTNNLSNLNILTNESPVGDNIDIPTDVTPDTMNHTDASLKRTPVEEAVSNEPPVKRLKRDDVCVTCLGVLQPAYWPHCYDMVTEVLNKKQYECETFACALSAPIASILRERYVSLHLKEAFSDYDDTSLTPLKEAWKWSFGPRLAQCVHKALDSGAVSPLLLTLNFEYPDDLQELEVLKSVSPSLFESRSRQRRRFTVEFTRRSVEQALEGASLASLRAQPAWSCAAPPVSAHAACVSVVATHAPIYLGGRYIKLSRSLPQTPWLVGGRRMMHSSVQEIITEPIAELYRLSVEEREHRLKFMSAGREDVDVRCLGDGRPFAIEITDPSRRPTEQELQRLCEQISQGGHVIVKSLVPVSREDLTQLKKGEETKCKTYEALCIKLTHSEEDQLTANGDTDVAVTARDIENMNSYRNTAGGARVLLQQRTPIRVLHRRPLLTRTRRILDLSAYPVPDHPQLFVVRVRTEAGTYVKEWAHGELGRTRPRLADALRARCDILALDVASVELQWPITHP